MNPLSTKWLPIPVERREIDGQTYYLIHAIRKHDPCLFPYVSGIGKTERRAWKDLYENIRLMEE